MHKPTLALAALLMATPAFGSERSEVMAPIHAFIGGMDKNDMKTAAAAYTASPVILDEFAPYHWSGPTAFADWGADFGKDSAAHGVTQPKLMIGKAKRIRIEGDHAYVVVPTDYSFKAKGKTVVEHALMTYTLDKTPSGWKIAGWAFSY